MTKMIYGFNLTKTGKMLNVCHPTTDWVADYCLDTGMGHLTGTCEDCQDITTKIHIRHLEDVDQMLKVLRLLRVMIESNRGEGLEKPDEFY